MGFTFFLAVLEDAFYAALAGIGFASISNPPKNAYKYCAVLSAVGHAIRYVMMHNEWHSFSLVVASFVAALGIGFLAVYCARQAHCPPETFSFFSLLPMIPGMYAYRTVEGIGDVLIYRGRAFIPSLFVPLHIKRINMRTSTYLEWF